MKSIRYFKPVALLVCCMLLASCNLIDFSEDCTYYGDVQIKPDWSGLPEGETKPVLTDIRLLSPQNNYSYRISADTLVKDIQATPYKVLAFNSYNLPDVHFVDMDCPETAKAVLKTISKDGKLYTVEAPKFYAAATDLQVVPLETVVCEPVLRPAVRQVNIDFVVIDGTRIGVESVGGELSGIAYRYAFKSLEQIESSAWLAFGSVRHEEEQNLFFSRLKVLGVNPDKQGTGRIDNLLEITLQTSDGKQYEETVDLTDILSGFTTRIIHITIELRMGILGLEVEITGWNVSDGGIIEL